MDDNGLFPARANYQSVGGVITSVTYWGKKGEVMLRFIHKFICDLCKDIYHITYNPSLFLLYLFFFAAASLFVHFSNIFHNI